MWELQDGRPSIKKGDTYMENEFEKDINGEADELFDQLNEAYESDRADFKRMYKKEFFMRRLDHINDTKDVFKRVLEEHRDDGQLSALILAAAASKALAANLLTKALSQGVPEFIAHMCDSAVLPMVLAWKDECDREALEKEIEELEK
jgi:hypothetical protein